MSADGLPTTIGSVVLVRTIGGGETPLMLRPRDAGSAAGEPKGGLGFYTPYGYCWVGPIVQDHLIRVVYEAPEK